MDDRTIRLTAKLVAAYARNNSITAGDLVTLIQNTYTALNATSAEEAPPAERPQPAVSVKKSISAEAITCLECGKPQKMLKRHLHTAHDLSVDEYRAKWNLPADYPVVAPAYAQHRSELAIKIGLGRKKSVDETAAADETQATEEAKPQHRYPSSRWSKPSM